MEKGEKKMGVQHIYEYTYIYIYVFIPIDFFPRLLAFFGVFIIFSVSIIIHVPLINITCSTNRIGMSAAMRNYNIIGFSFVNIHAVAAGKSGVIDNFVGPMS